MIDRISGSPYQSRPGLQQAPGNLQNVGTKGSIFRQALSQELTEPAQKPETRQIPSPKSDLATGRIAKPAELQKTQLVNTVPLQTIIQEVREIAENSGFIGISSEDVVRAYHSGQSFLADYKV
jgi:hypothetical protein